MNVKNIPNHILLLSLMILWFLFLFNSVWAASWPFGWWGWWWWWPTWGYTPSYTDPYVPPYENTWSGWYARACKVITNPRVLTGSAMTVKCQAADITSYTNPLYRFDIRTMTWTTALSGTTIGWWTGSQITMSPAIYAGITAWLYRVTCSIKNSSAPDTSAARCSSIVSIQTTWLCTWTQPDGSTWKSPLKPVTDTAWRYVPWNTLFSGSPQDLTCTWTCQPWTNPDNGRCVVQPTAPVIPRPWVWQCLHGSFTLSTRCDSDSDSEPLADNASIASGCDASPGKTADPLNFSVDLWWPSIPYTWFVHDNSWRESSTVVTIRDHMWTQKPTITFTANWATSTWWIANMYANSWSLVVSFTSQNPQVCQSLETYTIKLYKQPLLGGTEELVDAFSATLYYTDYTYSNTGILQQAGRYRLVLDYSGYDNSYSANPLDGIGNSELYNVEGETYEFIVAPNPSLDPLLTVTWSEKYADNNEHYDYSLTLKDIFWNPIPGWDTTGTGVLKNISHGYCAHSTSCSKRIRLDMTPVSLPGWISTALRIQTWALSWSGETSFKVSSFTPGVFTQQFQVRLCNWDATYTCYSQRNYYPAVLSWTQVTENSFKKPYKWELLVSKDGTTYDWASPEIGTMLRYKAQAWLSRTTPSLFSPSSSHSGSIKVEWISQSVIFGAHPSLQAQSFSSLAITDSTFLFNTRLNFVWDDDIKQIADLSGGDIWLKIATGASFDVTPVKISYTLSWHTVRYWLSNEDGATDMTPIRTSNGWFHWVKVVGWLQWVGKHTVTGQKENISDISMLEQRTLLRRNAYTYVRSMESDKVVNRVKYVEWDVTITQSPSSSTTKTTERYETLVVVNGNVTITGNLTGSTLWIIVLQDGYDANNTSKAMSGWNVFITPNVTNINAIIYADGGIVSANASGSPYTADSVARTSALLNALEIKWSIFTRNTIGGAILKSEAGVANRPYILPGGTQTNSFDTAMIYDLNYLRRGCWTPGIWNSITGNINCTPLSGEQPYPLTITYDASITSNPPKLFEIRK